MSLPSESDLRSRAEAAAAACGVDLTAVAGDHVGLSPVNGLPVSSLAWATPDDVASAVARAATAYDSWRLVPAPLRGAVVRRFGELLREHLDDLATLVTVEVGKIRSAWQGSRDAASRPSPTRCSGCCPCVPVSTARCCSAARTSTP